jgi:hypothetical protein
MSQSGGSHVFFFFTPGKTPGLGDDENPVKLHQPGTCSYELHFKGLGGLPIFLCRLPYNQMFRFSGEMEREHVTHATSTFGC